MGAAAERKLTPAAILHEVGYDEATVARVASLVRKERIKSDPEAQTLEDVICLVFLENYFAEFVPDGLWRKTRMRPANNGLVERLGCVIHP